MLKLSTRSKVVLAVSLAALVIFLRQQTAGMDVRFFQSSLSGTQGLVLYLLGDYSGSAQAYRAHFKSSKQPGAWIADPLSGAILAGDLAHAKEETSRLRQSDPKDLRAWLYSGVIALEEDQPVKALDAFTYVLEKNPDHADALIYASIAQSRAGAFDAAISGLIRTLRNSGTGAGMLSLLMVLQTTGNLDNKSDKEKPWCLLAHYYRYLRIFDPSNGRRALTYAQQAIDSGDRPADAYLTRAVVYRMRGRRERALEAALKAIEVRPGYGMAYWQAGYIYGRRGDITNQYLMNKAAFGADPTDPFYVGNLGYVLMEKLGDATQTTALFEKAVQANPDNWRAYYWLGRAYNYLGNHQRATDRLRRGVNVVSREHGIYRGQGYSLEKIVSMHRTFAGSLQALGQTDEAIATLHKAIALAPHIPSPRVKLAYLYLERQEYADAIKQANEALKRGVSSTDVQSGLCSLYHSAMDFERAVQCFRNVLARNPKDARALRLLPESIDNLNLQLRKK